MLAIISSKIAIFIAQSHMTGYNNSSFKISLQSIVSAYIKLDLLVIILMSDLILIHCITLVLAVRPIIPVILPVLVQCYEACVARNRTHPFLIISTCGSRPPTVAPNLFIKVYLFFLWHPRTSKSGKKHFPTHWKVKN